MAKLIAIRHGQSLWNLENRFTGWVDVDLSPQGEAEAKAAGELLAGTHIDCVFTSALKRAIRTADIALDVMALHGLPRTQHQALNERHYGDLQGLNKDECREKFGEEQVHIWRRSYDIPPPNGESLQDTQARVIPYYEQEIVPQLRQGKTVLVVAHGNSLRSLAMHLENLSKEEVLQLNIPTGKPRVYEFDTDLNVVHYSYIESQTASS